MFINDVPFITPQGVLHSYFFARNV